MPQRLSSLLAAWCTPRQWIPAGCWSLASSSPILSEQLSILLSWDIDLFVELTLRVVTCDVHNHFGGDTLLDGHCGKGSASGMRRKLFPLRCALAANSPLSTSFAETHGLMLSAYVQKNDYRNLNDSIITFYEYSALVEVGTGQYSMHKQTCFCIGVIPNE